jgi:hypothetical protein
MEDLYPVENIDILGDLMWQTLGELIPGQDVVALVFDHDLGEFVPKEC